MLDTWMPWLMSIWGHLASLLVVGIHGVTTFSKSIYVCDQATDEENK